MPIDNGKVFDDESDRWITRLEGETDRDALLRNRAERESIPARKSPARHPAVGVNPYAATLWIIGIVAIVIGLLSGAHATGLLDEYDPEYSDTLGEVASYGATGVVLVVAGLTSFIGAFVLSGFWWAFENVKRRP